MSEQANGEPAAAMFPENDPRLGPFTLEQRMEAAAMAASRKRWHLHNRADWLAIRLQYGRGGDVRMLSRMFEVSPSAIYDRIHDEGWISAMSEYDRRSASMTVWLAGVARGMADDAERRAKLKAISEWGLLSKVKPLTWQPRDRDGDVPPMTVNHEIQDIPDDAYFTERDSRRDERFAIYQQLERKLAELQSDWTGDGQGGAADGGRDDAGASGETGDGLAENVGGVGSAGGCAEGVAAVGEEDAGSA